jgi:hypothetical protein
MNSTDDRSIRRFFAERLVPAAEALRARGVRFFPLGPEPEAESWYEGPPRDADFVTLAETDIETALRARWEAQGLPEIAALAAPLLELAASLEVHEEQTPDISPFVYVMY